MKIKDWSANSKLAVGLTAALCVWMLLGLMSPSNVNDQNTGSVTSEQTGQSKASSFSVQVKIITSESYQKPILVRGRTEANRSVLVAAEIDGQVIQTPATEGGFVHAGEALCVLDPQNRDLRLEQAKALKNKASIEYDGARSLKDRGFQSKTQIATAKSNLALAAAEVKSATLAKENLIVRAPFSGIVQERMIDAGGFAQRGTACVRLIELSPVIVVGNIPESAVVFISVGDLAEVVMLNGSRLKGVVRYISRAADSITRTFKIEVELPNENGELVEGLSAGILMALAPVPAHRISPSLLSLLDDGSIGLKVIEDQDLVVHRVVRIVGDDSDSDGVWVTGLAETTTLITVGHEYVAVNSRVTTVLVGVSAGEAQ